MSRPVACVNVAYVAVGLISTTMSEDARTTVHGTASKPKTQEEDGGLWGWRRVSKCWKCDKHLNTERKFCTEPDV